MPTPFTPIDTLLAQARHLHQSGDLKAATAAYENILKSEPGHVPSLSLLGRLCAQAGNWQAAKKHLANALERAPQHAETLETLAIVLETEGNLKGAGERYLQALALNPDSANLHNNYGDLLRKMGKLETARSHLQQAIARQPRLTIAHNNLGVCLQALKLPQEAEQAFRAALALEPRYKRARRNLGALFLECNRFSEAGEQLEQALALDANDAETLGQYGLALLNLRRHEDAVRALRASVKIAPKASQNWLNLGLTLQELGDLDGGLQAFNQAIKTDPNNLQAQWHRAFAYFLRGEWAQAWEDYECRVQVASLPGQLQGVPTWQGEPLTGKRIFLIREQGIGDEIMFASCVGKIALQAAHTTLSCDPRLIPLLARSLPSIECVRQTLLKGGAGYAEHKTYDYQVFTGSIPRLLRKQDSDYPRRAYFKADPAKIASWRNRYDELGNLPKIGVSWRGGQFYGGEKRSTELAQWAELLRTTHAHFVNLQYGSTPEELTELSAMSGKPIHHWPDSDPLLEQDDFAAQLCALDLIISVTNATVHLAGALGLQTWTLLSYVPSWRWTMKGDTSLWYPNVTLIRQPSRGDWHSVFAQVQSRLGGFLASRKSP